MLFKMVRFPEIQTCYKFFIAGLILGCALGLKSTCIYLCLASGLSLIICYKYFTKPLKFIALFAFGGICGYLVINGWWMYKMYVLYDNPFFPFLNGIFHSPYFDDFNYSDRRFIPPLSIATIFPFVWTSGKHASAEISFYDLRGVFFYTLAIIFLIYMLVKPQRIKEFYINNKIWCFYAVFMLLGYVLWLNIFSIYRYLLVIEMGAAIFFVKLLFLYNPQTNLKLELYMSFAIILCGILILNSEQGIPWLSQRSPYAKVVYMEDISLPKNTLLKLYNFPTAGVIPLLAEKSDFRALGYQHLNAKYMLGSDFVERGKFRKIRDEIEKNHKGPVVIIYRDLFYSSHNYNRLHDALNKEIQGMYCRKLHTSLDAQMYVCVPPELKQQILLEEEKYG